MRCAHPNTILLILQNSANTVPARERTRVPRTPILAFLAITRASAFLASMRLPGLRSLGVGDRVGREPINIRVYPCFEKCFAISQNIPETIITPINAAATPASFAVYVPRKAYIAETVAFPSNSPHATLLKESFFIPA